MKVVNEKSLNAGKIYSRFGIVIILIAELVFFACANELFFSYDNIIGVVRQVAFIGISAVGMTAVILTGGIDISVGAMLALSGVVSAKATVEAGLPLGVAILIALLLGLAFGALSGTLISKFRVPALIATLAMQTVIKGVTYLLTNAYSVKGITSDFKYFGQGYIGDVLPVPVFFLIVIFVFGWLLLNKTYIGRRIYAVGGNKEAARLSGINTNRIIIGVYALCGVLTAFAGFMMAGRLGSGQPAVGSGFEMDVITAVVLGGVSVMGGKGNVINVLFGAIIMGVLTNGMIMMGISEYWRWVVQGVVLAAVVAIRNANSKETP
jgi:ribose transport system permease protein